MVQALCLISLHFLQSLENKAQELDETKRIVEEQRLALEEHKAQGKREGKFKELVVYGACFSLSPPKYD